jgi:parvulin-like peptidyl-prolyl isomerase
MAIQTKEEFQDKASKKLDRVLNKKSKRKPLSEESWNELNQRGATLAEQFEWIRLDKIKKERLNHG